MPPQVQFSFEQAHHFSISRSNLGVVGGDLLTSGSESLTARARRHSRGKSSKTHKTSSTSQSLHPNPVRPPSIATSEAQFSDSEHDADISESESLLSTISCGPHQPSCFECSTRRQGAPKRIRNSVQTWASPVERPRNPSPPSIYSLDCLSDDNPRRRGENFYTTPKHPQPPSISVDPPSHYLPRLPRSIQPHVSYADTRPRLIEPPVYPSRAIEPNTMPAEGVRDTAAHPIPHRGISPPNSVDISWCPDPLGRNNRRSLRRQSRCLRYS